MTNHGTVLAYRRGCRCDPCRAKKAEAAAKHRANKGQYQAAHVQVEADPIALTGGDWVYDRRTGVSVYIRTDTKEAS